MNLLKRSALVPAVFALLSSAAFAGAAPLVRSLAGDYWKDIVSLCTEYPRSSPSSCNQTMGARTILGEVARNCATDPDCLNRAVEICRLYSPRTHAPCHASNGLTTVLEEIERVSKFYK